jgi:hypothetical protein
MEHVHEKVKHSRGLFRGRKFQLHMEQRQQVE